MGLAQLLTDPGNFTFYSGKQIGFIQPNSAVNPRNIPFGNDRPNGGSSNQPYIKIGYPDQPGVNITNINLAGQAVNSNSLPGVPGATQGFSTNQGNSLTDSLRYNSQNWGPDFLNRGNLYGYLRASDDIKRLTRYFIDDRSPNALLFIAKQNLLSRTGVKTEATYGPAYAGGALNDGIYLPTSTIAQAGVSLIGGHLLKQGIDPVGAIPGVSVNSYQETIANTQLSFSLLPNRISNNRLVTLTTAISSNKPSLLKPPVKNYNINTPGDDTILSYGGGPGSVFGIGKTNIKFATTNAGVPIKTLANFGYNKNNPITSNYKTWDYSLISNFKPPTDLSDITRDFRSYLEPTSYPQSSFLSISPNYVTKNVETNFNLAGKDKVSVGSKLRNRSNYASGSTVNGKSSALDRVNAYPIYKSTTKDGSRYGKDGYEELNDIIPFNIAILNNDIQGDQTFKKYLHFRAFIDSFSDSYKADWKAIEYMGRAEKFYKYGGFDRGISMAFTVVAQSKNEINAMYEKLNFLASSLAPEYLDSLTSGYMTGNIAYLTLGGYVYEQPGIITSLTYDIPEESPWEIGIDANGQPADVNSVRQLPHIIRVSGFNFIPIHKFRPEKQTFLNDLTPEGKGKAGSTRLAVPGNQQFIDQRRPLGATLDEFGNDLNSKIENELGFSFNPDYFKNNLT
jgi:hypothetical protein